MSEIVRVMDILPTPEEISEDNDPLFNIDRDGVLMKLFGFVPDYSDKAIDALWDDVFNADEAEMIAYCKKRGVDVTGPGGDPVEIWRDIAVVLMADEKGLLAEYKA